MRIDFQLLVFKFALILLLFPTISLLNIGDFPILRLDFIGQILILVLLIMANNFKIEKDHLFLFAFSLFLITIPNFFNLFFNEEFNSFAYFKMFVQISNLYLISFFAINCKNISKDKYNIRYYSIL